MQHEARAQAWSLTVVEPPQEPQHVTFMCDIACNMTQVIQHGALLLLSLLKSLSFTLCYNVVLTSPCV